MKKLFATLCTALLFALPAMAAVDLNKASETELQTVNGIGPAKAKAIVEYRQKNGNFKSVDDLDNVKGFGKKSLDKIRNDLTVGNATAASAGKSADTKSLKEDIKLNKKAEKK